MVDDELTLLPSRFGKVEVRERLAPDPACIAQPSHASRDAFFLHLVLDYTRDERKWVSSRYREE